MIDRLSFIAFAGWLAVGAVGSPVFAETTRFDWAAGPGRTPFSPSTERVEGGAEGGGTALRITGSAGRQTTHPLLTVEDPPVDSEVYAFEGRIRYEGVEGRGYLELWNEFPDGNRYFTRTVASQGAMAGLDGTSEWRTFSVPFNRSGTAQKPRLLELQVVLPGAGTVTIGPVVLKDIGRAGISPPFAFRWAAWSLAAITILLALIALTVVLLLRRA